MFLDYLGALRKHEIYFTSIEKQAKNIASNSLDKKYR